MLVDSRLEHTEKRIHHSNLFLLLLIRSFRFTRLSRIPLIQDLLRNSRKLFSRESSEKGPGEIERLENVALFGDSLVDEFLFESTEEREGELGYIVVSFFVGRMESEKTDLLFGRESFFSHDGLHRSGVLSNSVEGVELVGNISVISSSQFVSDSRFHQSGERGEYVDRRVNLRVGRIRIGRMRG